jgi:hypothetical protein
MNQLVRKVPTMQELVETSEQDLKENALTVILNQNPPDAWLKQHPMIGGYRYLPIERVEYLLTRVFGKWSVEVKDVQVIANSVAVTVRLHVSNPITGEVDIQEGVGAAPIQTKKGAGAMDWNQAQTTGVQMALPMAKTYAVKDAAEQFGKLFGKDVARKTQIDYNSLLKENPKTDPVEDRITKMLEACTTIDELDMLNDSAIDEGLVFSDELLNNFTQKRQELEAKAKM